MKFPFENSYKSIAFILRKQHYKRFFPKVKSKVEDIAPSLDRKERKCYNINEIIKKESFFLFDRFNRFNLFDRFNLFGILVQRRCFDESHILSRLRRRYLETARGS